jgi:hypothetical protein
MCYTPGTPSPITYPISPLIRWGLRFGTLAWALWDAYIEEEDLVGEDIYGYEWRRVEWSFSRPAPTGFSEDRATFTMDIVNITSGGVDNSWITADYTTCETQLLAYWANVRPYVAPNHTLVEWRWFKQAFENPLQATKRFRDHGPPERVTAVGTAGTASGSSYPIFQTALTVTEQTALRAHWGRLYIPGCPAPSVTDQYGRATTAAVDAIATAFSNLYNNLRVANFPVVVPSTQHEGILEPVIFGVNAVQVDSTPDVIRSRRPRTTSYRNRVPI